MKPGLRLLSLGLSILLAISSCAKKEDAVPKFSVPVEYHKLENGLKVVLSPDATAPTATVAVYYNIGFRIEPKDRTGFAHLFEHMMFQGSQNLGKMEFIQLIQRNGGILNGSTRFDFTNYFQVVPSNKLETILWGEADRMKGLAITKENLKNQQEVVKNEVKVNVLNQPYGGFPWLDMPQYANTNWYNAHNFYGDLKDLDAATLEDVQSFFKTYYAPNNAALVVVGDFEPKQTLEWIKKYFGSIAAQPQPAKPDISEPEQTVEKKSKKQDPLATRPAVAVAYQMPARNTPEYYAMGLLDQILVQGEDSKLHQALVQKKGYTGQVSGGINYLGNMFNYNGPMLWMMDLIHDQNVSADSIMLEVDRIMQELAEKPVDQATLNRALVKMRSSLYGEFNQTGGLGKMDLLACFALFDDNPARINTLEDEFRKVTPELIRETAKKYLRSTNRTILSVEATNVMKNKMGAAQ
ncbi:insulinase family protein [bacterium]|nr:insulinase family protein [bacterium]NUN44482.1 insulinase family protein [bacterium]